MGRAGRPQARAPGGAGWQGGGGRGRVGRREVALFFLYSTAFEWRRLIYQHHLTIATNLFGTSFYSLVGLHATHVVVGLTLLTLVFWLSLRGVVTRNHSEHIEMISWYWHFVDAVWVVVFTVVYIIGR